jgi:hypothetical protein
MGFRSAQITVEPSQGLDVDTVLSPLLRTRLVLNILHSIDPHCYV